MRLIFNTFFHLDPACGRLYPPNPPDIHRDRLFSRPLPPFPVPIAIGNGRAFPTASERHRIFFCKGLKPLCSQIGHGYAVRAWKRSNRFRRFDRWGRSFRNVKQVSKRRHTFERFFDEIETFILLADLPAAGRELAHNSSSLIWENRNSITTRMKILMPLVKEFCISDWNSMLP